MVTTEYRGTEPKSDIATEAARRDTDDAREAEFWSDAYRVVLRYTDPARFMALPAQQRRERYAKLARAGATLN